MADPKGKIILEVVTPSRKVAMDRCDSVHFPGILGEAGVLPEHSPLITTLFTGLVHYNSSESGQSVKMAVRNGFGQVMDNHVMLLADEAARKEDLKPETVAEELSEVEKMILSPDTEDEARDDLIAKRDWLQTCQSLLS